MTAIEYLTVEDLLELTRRLGVGPVRDLGLLDAAAVRPQSSAFGTDAYPTHPLKAAALLQSIVSHHALVDGNKRLAWLATVVFGELNAAPVELTDDVAFDLVMASATGELDVEQIAVALYPNA